MRLRTKILVAVSIFLLSFSTRSLQAVDLTPVMYTSEQPFGGLSLTYDQRASSILEGEGILGPYDVDPSRTVWLAQAPGYSIYLSWVYRIVGRRFLNVQVVQNALNSLSPILIFLIAGSMLSWRVGVASGLLAALEHHLAHISNFILPDSISALPLLAAIYLLVITTRLRHDSYWVWAAAGVLLGSAAWLRSQTMLLAPFVAVLLVAIAARRLPALKRAVLMPIACILVISPITIRNYLVYGEFVPIHIGLGIVLWEGIADASGDRFGAVALDVEVAAQDAVLYNNPRYGGSWATPDGIMRDRDRVRKSIDIILHHPVWYAGVMLKRMRDMVKYSAHAPLVYKIGQTRALDRTLPVKPEWESMVDNDSGLTIGRAIFWIRPVIRALQRMIKEPMSYSILVGSVILFVACWRRALFLAMVPLYYFLFQSFTHTEFRYTLPMQYFLFVFAAIVWVVVLGWFREGARYVFNRVPARAGPNPAD
jgi:hypothetical protein